MTEECKRGAIYLVNWNPGRGSEQTGKRPALVIQNDIGNRYSPTTIVAPCSTAVVKTYPFIVRVKAGESGLDKDNAINLAQIMTVDKTRLEVKLGELPAKKMLEVDQALKNSLGIEL
ncbi:type II toxin-antitoxin system PemK/MazF family toxin [Desulfonatronospira sp.]|uniref:type II toxin-antitoxin system PemK/MazF family toxin n=1 Tax=Desulfonatronospira sp. TaxID=1962951 RepID=UPI0025C672A3|nr:type II toxin-antitoxin system PemK/MazF family toxin [Desulfonatronospira sp.]